MLGIRNARSLRKAILSRIDNANKGTSDPRKLLCEILTNICSRNAESGIKKLNYINAFVQLLSKCNKDNAADNSNKYYGLNVEDIFYCLRVILIQDSLQVRAAGLRALRCMLHTREDILLFNKLHFPFLVARSLDLELRMANARVLMTERIEALQTMRKILSICPRLFTMALMRPLISIALRSYEESDRIIRVTLAMLCELSVLNTALFVKCGGVTALIKNVTLLPTTAMREAICGSLIYLMNFPRTRALSNVDVLNMSAVYTGLDGCKLSGFPHHERQLECTKSALLALLKSWPGFLYFCRSNYRKNSPLKCLVDSLLSTHTVVRKSILDLFYELLNLSKPNWTSDTNDAISSITPSTLKSSYKLTEEYLLGEGNRFLAPTYCRVSLRDAFIGFMLYHLLNANIASKLAEVIITSEEQELANYCVIFLGKLTNLAEKLLPVNCYNFIYPLEDLISYGVTGCPANPLSDKKWSENYLENRNTPRNENDFQKNKNDFQKNENYYPKYENIFRKRENHAKENELDSNQILDCTLNIQHSHRNASKIKQRKALNAMSVLERVEKILKTPPRPATYYAKNMMRNANPENLSKSYADLAIISDTIFEKNMEKLFSATGVLFTMDSTKWKWEYIKSVLTNASLKMSAAKRLNFGTFLKRLIWFYKPSSRLYSELDGKKIEDCNSTITGVAYELFDFLLALETPESVNFLNDFLKDVENELSILTGGDKLHSCIMGVNKVRTTLVQNYFLFIGRLTSTEKGTSILEGTEILHFLDVIATTLGVDAYVKLIVSALNYENAACKNILKNVLSCEHMSSRLYATRFIRLLLRAKNCVLDELSQFLIETLTVQLYDQNEKISKTALAALSEAADNERYLSLIINLHPNLLHLGDEGVLLFAKFLSDEKFFADLQKSNFVDLQMRKWASNFNMRYVMIVEGDLHNSFTEYKIGDDGKYRKRMTGVTEESKNILAPPHLYGQLAHHALGFQTLIKNAHFHELVERVLNENIRASDIVALKSALWAVGSIGCANLGAEYLCSENILQKIVHYAEKCEIYSIKATSFNILQVIASSGVGSTNLKSRGWICNKSYAYRRDVVIRENENSMDVMTPIKGEKKVNKFSRFGRKCATLPQAVLSRTFHRGRSLSDIKSDRPIIACDIVTNFKNITESYPADSNTSGIGSYDSVNMKVTSTIDKHHLSPIPSTESLESGSASLSPCREEGDVYSTNKEEIVELGSTIQEEIVELSSTNKKDDVESNIHFSTPLHEAFSSAFEEKSKFFDYPNHYPKSICLPVDIKNLYDGNDLDEINTKNPYFEEIVEQSENMDLEDLYLSTKKRHNVSRCFYCSRKIFRSPELSVVGDMEDMSLRGKLVFPDTLLEKTSDIPDASLREKSTRPDSSSQGDPSIEALVRPDILFQDKSVCPDKPADICETDNISLQENPDISDHKIPVHSDRTFQKQTSCPDMTVPKKTIRRDTTIRKKSVCSDMNLQKRPFSLRDSIKKDQAYNTHFKIYAPEEISDDEKLDLEENLNLRGTILDLVEECINPITDKMIKQRLLVMKQTHPELFRDVCLYTDVCVFLSCDNYRIQARQFIQDLFLDATFEELYEDCEAILGNFKKTVAEKDFEKTAKTENNNNNSNKSVREDTTTEIT